MKYKVTLNGRIYEVEVTQGEAILLDEYEATAPAPSAVPSVASAPAPAPTTTPTPKADGEAICSPLPGNVLRIPVKAGDTVKAGDVLIVLEAMKMENEIVAARDGTIAQVTTTVGAVVDTGTPLAVLV